MTRLPAFFCALIFVVVAPVTGKAPARADSSYLIDTWEIEDGLPDNSATAMVQDRQGYLWFGTFGGLVRFDGVSFTRFDPFNTPQLPSDGIVNLHLDLRGRLWVSTTNGLVMHDDSGWHMIDRMPEDWVRTFAERSNGDLLLTTFVGALWEFTDGHLRRLPPAEKAGSGGYFGHVDEAGRWWAIHSNYVGTWDGTQWTLARDIPKGITGYGRARDGGMWLLFGQTLRKYEKGSEVKRLELPESPGGFWGMSEDRDGNIWISTYDNGLCRVSPEGNLRRWTTKGGLSGKSTRFVFEDSEGDLWVGTNGGGLQRFRPRRFGSIGLDEGLSEPVVQSISPTADGSLLIATYGGGVVRSSDGKLETIPLSGWPKGYSVFAHSVLCDRAGRIWIGTSGDGVWLIDSQGSHHIAVERTGGGNIVTLFEDSRGRIWMGGGATTVYEDGAFRRFAKDSSNPTSDVRFTEDSQGTIWAASREGVFRFLNGRFAEIREKGHPIQNVNAICADSRGAVWIAPSHDDLLCFHSGAIARIDSAAGISVGDVRSIVEDALGDLWMTSNRGVIRVRRDALVNYAEHGGGPVTTNVFDLDDGLPGVEFPSETEPVSVRDKNGRLWFATSKGVATIDPATLRLNERPPTVDIQTLVYRRMSGRSAPAHNATGDPGREEIRLPGPFTNPTRLPPGSRRLEFDYAALSLSAPSKIHYQVKLDPIDDNWQDVGNQRIVYYNDPAPGDYVFRVRAANNDGLWNMRGASLAFTIQPFFWQTAWFRDGVGFALILLGAGAAWLIAHGRHRRAMELQTQRNELAHLSRVTMLGELSGSLAHELNQPLAAILSNAQAARRFMNQDQVDQFELKEILEDIINDDKRAGEIIGRLRLLLKKGEVNRELLDMNELVLEVLRLAHSDLLNHEVVVETELESLLPRVRGDRIQLQQVLLNLVMNAGDAVATNANGDRRITVRTCRLDNESIGTSVIDQGCGIPEDRLDRVFEPFYTTKPHGMGLGLSVCRTIIAAHGGELSATNNPRRGATFYIKLDQAAEARNE